MRFSPAPLLDPDDQGDSACSYVADDGGVDKNDLNLADELAKEFDQADRSWTCFKEVYHIQGCNGLLKDEMKEKYVSSRNIL